MTFATSPRRIFTTPAHIEQGHGGRRLFTHGQSRGSVAARSAAHRLPDSRRAGRMAGAMQWWPRLGFGDLGVQRVGRGQAAGRPQAGPDKRANLPVNTLWLL